MRRVRNACSTETTFRFTKLFQLYAHKKKSNLQKSKNCPTFSHAKVVEYSISYILHTISTQFSNNSLMRQFSKFLALKVLFSQMSKRNFSIHKRKQSDVPNMDNRKTGIFSLRISPFSKHKHLNFHRFRMITVISNGLAESSTSPPHFPNTHVRSPHAIHNILHTSISPA